VHYRYLNISPETWRERERERERERDRDRERESESERESSNPLSNLIGIRSVVAG
jgi:hypothetical protein